MHGTSFVLESSVCLILTSPRLVQHQSVTISFTREKLLLFSNQFYIDPNAHVGDCLADSVQSYFMVSLGPQRNGISKELCVTQDACFLRTVTD